MLGHYIHISTETSLRDKKARSFTRTDYDFKHFVVTE